jgi:hypothetical protein
MSNEIPAPSVFAGVKYPKPSDFHKNMTDEEKAARELEIFKIWQSKQRDILQRLKPFLDAVGADMETIIYSDKAPMEARLRLLGLYGSFLMSFLDEESHPEDGLPFLLDKLLMDTEDLDVAAADFRE